ncbi:MAG: SMC family ATPase, partial [Chloroflexi bacterium]|nr:SMC family ATPase [Chloroflexota bacterium]
MSARIGKRDASSWLPLAATIAMIPIRLQLRNFMCYRDDVPPLVLDSLHVACLCGENGAGKSALLDAITWALWGKARADSDDDLIALGRQEMEVELVFDVAGDRYRVVRKRERGAGKKAGKSLLELEVATSAPVRPEPVEGPGAAQGFRAITGNNTRETQQKLIALLHLDYETFVNSAFLLQGRADAFTVKSAGDRKQVLAEILGLGYYDRLERRARDQAGVRRADRLALQGALESIEAELARRPAYEQRAAQARESLAQREGEAQAASAELDRLRAAKQALDQQAASLKELRRRNDEAHRDLERLEQQAATLDHEIAAFEAVAREAKAITAGYTLFVDARERKDRLDEAARAYVEQSERVASLEREIAAARAKIERDESVL